VKKVKVIKFWKLCAEDLDKGIAKFGKSLEEMKKAHEKYPKYIVPRALLYMKTK